MWHDVGNYLNLNKKGQKGKKDPIFSWFCPRVREEREKSQGFLPRSTEFLRSKFGGPRTKVHRINEGYVWVLKTLDFSKNSNEEFWKSKVSGLGSVHEAS